MAKEKGPHHKLGEPGGRATPSSKRGGRSRKTPVSPLPSEDKPEHDEEHQMIDELLRDVGGLLVRMHTEPLLAHPRVRFCCFSGRSSIHVQLRIKDPPSHLTPHKHSTHLFIPHSRIPVDGRGR